MRKLGATPRPFGHMSVCAARLGLFFRLTFFVVAAVLTFCSSAARAQQQHIISYGQLAVTGYSGSMAVAPPQGADPFDYLRIKLDGPSARVVEVRVLGPQGQLSTAAKPFTVTASQVGQVFGVTLDNAAPPNIYVAATSVYGLNIAVLDQNGQQKRVRKGAPGAQWMAGQFGPPGFGGGPGSIWKIDGTTGNISLFANVQNAMLGAASLGGLAFDPRTKQIFAVDRSTGIVYRFGLDGVQRGTYDHGIEGRGPAGLPPIPQPPGVPVNITSPAFNTENPTTWGFALPARRVNAVAVLGDRLFYSLPQQIWSVGISGSGAVSASPRLEVEVPALQDGVEIASIAFDPQGRMYLAERGATTGDYFRYNLANGGASRVLRFVRKLPGDPAPGLWRLTPDQYSIGLAPNYANAQGGVALGFGYNQDNVIDFNNCGPTLWSTGERLLDPGDPTAPPDSYPKIDGLQANATSLVQPQNTPPQQSWFIDYDDLNGDANYRGHMGAVATLPCPGGPSVLPPPPAPPPPPVTCPPGTYFSNGQCLIIPTCPPNTYYSNGKCYYENCPPGFYFDNGQCKPIPVPCPPSTFFYKGQCIPIGCPPGMIKKPNGQCKCPAGEIFFQGQCVPPQNCPPGMIEFPGGICWCPLGTIFNDGLCQPGTCPPGEVWKNGFCQPCGNNQIIVNGQCKSCPAGEKKQGNKCVPICGPNLVFDNGQCKPCPIGQVAVNGVCVNQPCPNGKVPWKDTCVPACSPGEIHQEPDGACKPPGEVQPCAANQELWKGQCVPKCSFNEIHKEPAGACGPPDEVAPPPGQCLPPNTKWGNNCLPPCPPNQIHQPPDGACGAPQLCVGLNVEAWNGLCVEKCPNGKVHALPDGHCVEKPQLPNFPLIPKPGPLPLPPGLPGNVIPQPPPPGPPPPKPPVLEPGIKVPEPVQPLVPPVVKTPTEPLPPPPASGPSIKVPGVQLPGGQLPGVQLPKVVTPPTQPPPAAEPPTAPPTTGPTVTVPGVNLPAVQLPGTAKPPAGSPPPQQPPPQQKPLPSKIAPQTSAPPQETPPPSTSTPPAAETPQSNLPVLKRLQQLKRALEPQSEQPQTGGKETEKQTQPGTTPEVTPQTVQPLQPQMTPVPQ